MELRQSLPDTTGGGVVVASLKHLQLVTTKHTSYKSLALDCVQAFSGFRQYICYTAGTAVAITLLRVIEHANIKNCNCQKKSTISIKKERSKD